MKRCPIVRPQAEAITAAITHQIESFEVVFVDDGSTDETAALVLEYAKQDPRVRLLKLEKNYGQITAMARGIADAKGEIIVTMDGDLHARPIGHSRSCGRNQIRRRTWCADIDTIAGIP